MEDLYELRWLIEGVPLGSPITVPSTARAVVDEATDHSDFDPTWLKLRIPTYGLEFDAEETAGRLRSWFVGWAMHQMQTANDVSPFRDWTKDLFLYGKAVWKIIADHENWPVVLGDEGKATPEEIAAERDRVVKARQGIIPIVLRTIYPLAVYEDPAVGEKQWAIEEYDHEATEILPRYKDWLPSGKSRPDAAKRRKEMLDDADLHVKLWDCYQIGEGDYEGEKVCGLWHQVLINEGPESAFTAATPPVFLPYEPFPYTIKFSGFGRQSSGRYHEKARGILFAAQSLIKAEARRHSQLDAIISQFAWPTTVVTGPKGRFDFKWGPNEVNYVPPGVTVTAVTPTIPAGPVQAALATIQAGIERATFGSVIRGDKPPQTTSAAQLSILSGQARLRFGSPRMQQEAGLRDIASKAFHIIKYVMRSESYVLQLDDTSETDPKQVVIRPEDIPEPFFMDVKIKGDPVELQEREMNRAIMLKREGIIDEEEAAEMSGVTDTAAMRQRRIRDMVLMGSPNIVAALGEQFLLDSGLDLEALELEKMMRDLFKARSAQQLQEQIMGGGGVGGQAGGANPAGSQPAPEEIGPVPLGGAPANASPTEAQMNAEMGTV